MNWERLCRRTEDPKLAWLEKQLDRAGISHRRNGYSFHAPILEVDAQRRKDAWAILSPVDDIADDESFWTEDPDGCSCGEPEGGRCAFCQVSDVIALEVNHARQRPD